MLEHCDGKPILAVEEPRFGRGGHSDDVLGVGGHESVVRVQPTAMPGGPAQWIPTCAVDSKAQQRDLCVPPNATQPMVLKALQDGKRGKTELSFYRRHQHVRVVSKVCLTALASSHVNRGAGPRMCPA